jgi:hypothetical protein
MLIFLPSQWTLTTVRLSWIISPHAERKADLSSRTPAVPVLMQDAAMYPLNHPVLDRAAELDGNVDEVTEDDIVKGRKNLTDISKKVLEEHELDVYFLGTSELPECQNCGRLSRVRPLIPLSLPTVFLADSPFL